jgi:hypothetical protein
LLSAKAQPGGISGLICVRFNMYIDPNLLCHFKQGVFILKGGGGMDGYPCSLLQTLENNDVRRRFSWQKLKSFNFPVSHHHLKLHL